MQQNGCTLVQSCFDLINFSGIDAKNNLPDIDGEKEIRIIKTFPLVNQFPVG